MSLRTVIRKILKPTKIKLVSVLAFAALSAGIGASVYTNASAVGSVSQSDPASSGSAASTCDQTDPANDVIWCGASSVSVLQNDFNNGDGVNSGASIRNIYKWFGISSIDIDNMTTDSYPGYVTSSGDVYLNSGNLLVATNALTGGRQDITGSTEQSENGTTFYSRPPRVSFQESQLSAYVVMQNGVFQFAIITSCGNAVEAHPQLPNYTIIKQVRKIGTTAYSSNVTVEAGTVVQYSITVNSTGQVPVDGVVVKDKLPAGITYDSESGTLKLGSDHLSSADATDFFSNVGLTTPSINVGDHINYTFNAFVGKGETYATCKEGTLDNTASVSSAELPTEESLASVKETCPSPSQTCTSPSGQTYPYGSSECTPATVTTCTSPSGQTYPTGSSECQSASATASATSSTTSSTTELVNTGPGNIFAVFGGASIAGALGYWYLAVRRAKRSL